MRESESVLRERGPVTASNGVLETGGVFNCLSAISLKPGAAGGGIEMGLDNEIFVQVPSVKELHIQYKNATG